MRSLFLAALLVPATALAVPTQVTHQGRLFDALGGAITGSTPIDFRLYSTPSGGTAVWTESHTLDLDAGYFTVVLGSTTELDETIFDGDTMYLGIAVDGGAELPERAKIVSVPYAILARTANTAETATNVSGGVVDATEIRIDGTTVIDSSGALATGTLDIDRLPIGTSADTVAAGDHLHSEYSLTTHDHDADYSGIGHDHDPDYAPISHSHGASLADLSCSDGQIPRWDGASSAWACGDDKVGSLGLKVEFAATGSDQIWTVPDGVSQITVLAWGAAGGGSNAEGRQFPGGPGGYSQATLQVSPGEDLSILVGQGGAHGGTREAYPNGGQAGIRTGYSMGGGGGRTAVVRGTTELLVAGGGGGAGGTGWNSPKTTSGGAGGGLTGENGSGADDGGSTGGAACAGKGGSQSAGGAGGASAGGTNCGTYTSNRAGDKNNGGDEGNFADATGNSGGGGGDGYYGGGAGVLHAGGGGGSSYADSASYAVQLLQSSDPTKPPMMSDANYKAGVGVSAAAAAGGDGRLVIIY